MLRSVLIIYFVENIESGLENQSFNDKRSGVEVNKILCYSLYPFNLTVGYSNDKYLFILLHKQFPVPFIVLNQNIFNILVAFGSFFVVEVSLTVTVSLIVTATSASKLFTDTTPVVLLIEIFPCRISKKKFR